MHKASTCFPVSCALWPALWPAFHALYKHDIADQAASLVPAVLCNAEWAVPQMLRIVACIHALYTPAGRQALAPIGAALEMAPQVGARAACLVVHLSHAVLACCQYARTGALLLRCQKEGGGRRNLLVSSCAGAGAVPAARPGGQGSSQGEQGGWPGTLCVPLLG